MRLCRLRSPDVVLKFGSESIPGPTWQKTLLQKLPSVSSENVGDAQACPEGQEAFLSACQVCLGGS